MSNPNDFIKRAKLTSFTLTRLEEQYRDLAEVEVDEVLRFVCDVAAKVTSDDAVPGRVVLLVELLLDEGSDILFDVKLLEGLVGAVDGVLLHLLRHVGVLDNCFAVRGGHWNMGELRER